MALFGKVELAYSCGVGKSSVSNALSRGKLTQNKDGLIDDKNKKNKIQIEKWLIRSNLTSYKPLKEQIEIKEKKLSSRRVSSKPKSTVESVKKKPSKKSKEKVINLTGQDLEDLKKQTEIEWKVSQIVLNELKASKLKGENVPTKLIETVLIILGKSFQSNYKDGADEILLEIQHKHKISIEDYAKLKAKQNTLINRVHTTAVNEAKQQILAIVSNVSQQIVNEND